ICGFSIFAGTEGSGIYLSMDNGLNWGPVNNALFDLKVRSFAVTGNTIIAGTSFGISISSDNGGNWTQGSFMNMNGGLPGYGIFAVEISGTNVFAGLCCGKG